MQDHCTLIVPYTILTAKPETSQTYQLLHSTDQIPDFRGILEDLGIWIDKLSLFQGLHFCLTSYYVYDLVAFFLEMHLVLLCSLFISNLYKHIEL